jgi:hypothetical protein
MYSMLYVLYVQEVVISLNSQFAMSHHGGVIDALKAQMKPADSPYADMMAGDKHEL